MEEQEEKICLEEQFILRLPMEQAQKVRKLLHSKPRKIKKLMNISLDPDSLKLIVDIKKMKLFGTLRKLPTIIESYKTNINNNKCLLFKTADICYIAECGYEENTTNPRHLQHGYCPPLKNCKKNRFRKTLYNKDVAIEAEALSKELHFLLAADLDAVSSRFELIHSENDATNMERQNEILFGKLSSDSSDVSIIGFYKKNCNK
ncbi:transcription initiation factor TFIID subunit 7-like isoform X1 [Diorhabda carinulata]|uniref:transcription initiation factor TFIID subunit 7-like isoform X1 n=1 Tax=Diorhabda carinulata TaxID=1163345 RepID=UPI0025A11B14|nr:transcription initiation factor TFIID subunit 7-like isoform X1 [Diorhabda carinulata]